MPREVRSRLLHQRARLAGVTTPAAGQPLPTWQPSRLNARYQPALHLARAVLDGTSPEHLPGGLRIEGFLFDMNRLFEDFVTVALRESLRGTGLTGALQDPHHLDEAHAIRMRPDFVVYRPGGVPVAVADAKYKSEKRSGYPDSDLYQMLAYCTALGLREGHLVYAKGNAPHAAHRVRHAGITLHQHALDLNQAPAALLADVAALSRRMGTAPHAPPSPHDPPEKAPLSAEVFAEDGRAVSDRHAHPYIEAQRAGVRVRPQGAGAAPRLVEGAKAVAQQ